jgi:hypothetical protein
VSDIVLERLSLLYLPSDRPTASLLPVTQSIVVQLASATSSLSNGVSDRTGAHQLKLNVLVPHRFSRLTEERLVTPFGPVAQNSPNHSWVGHRIEGNRPVQLYCGQYTEFWYSRLIEAVKVELPRSALLPGGPGEWSTHIVPCPERHPLDLHPLHTTPARTACPRGARGASCRRPAAVLAKTAGRRTRSGCQLSRSEATSRLALVASRCAAMARSRCTARSRNLGRGISVANGGAG